MEGTVRWYNGKKAFGFIYSEELGRDIFVHVSGILPNGDRGKMLTMGDVVEFETESEVKGLKAVKVNVIKKEESDGNTK